MDLYVPTCTFNRRSQIFSFIGIGSLVLFIVFVLIIYHPRTPSEKEEDDTTVVTKYTWAMWTFLIIAVLAFLLARFSVGTGKQVTGTGKLMCNMILGARTV